MYSLNANVLGTDATIHEHIKKILEREYATKHADGLIYPTVLGMALIDGYDNMRIDLSLSKPDLRRQVHCRVIFYLDRYVPSNKKPQIDGGGFKVSL